MKLSSLSDTSANGGIPASTAFISAGLYLAKPPATSFKGINLASSGASHPPPACRMFK